MRVLAFAAALAFLGACSSGGGGCDGGPPKQGNGESTSMGGASGVSKGGLGEPVSFQGIGPGGKKEETPPAQPPARQAAASSSGGHSQSLADNGSQSVVCGGFPNLPPDCSKDPAFDAIKKKCCPAGQVEQCQGIPGGARLIGRACTGK